MFTRTEQEHHTLQALTVCAHLLLAQAGVVAWNALVLGLGLQPWPAMFLSAETDSGQTRVVRQV